MKQRCFDTGMIQAFTDGELASDLSQKIIRHVAVCEKCANVLAETEQETELTFSLLDEELNVLVPTERLRTKLFESIREIEDGRKATWWRDVAAGIFGAISFRNPGFVALAASLLFVSALAIGVKFYTGMVGMNEVAVLDGGESPDDALEISAGSELSDGPVEAGPPSEIVERADRTFDVNTANGSSAPGIGVRRRMAARLREKAANPGKSAPAGDPESDAGPVIESEASFLNTIATLDSTVGYRKESLRPTERVSFEKDLALVDDAISKMRDEVRKDPKNQAAREVLRASYQNKIDLLNSVADNTELMASLQ